MKLLTPKQLAEIREHYKNRCAELLEKGLTPADCDDDLEMIGQLSDHITALEAELQTANFGMGKLRIAVKEKQRADKAEKRITALEADNHILEVESVNWKHCAKVNETLKKEAKQTISALEAEIESARKVIALYERDIPLLTRGMEFHPKGWEHACECQMCMSYEQGQE